MAVRLILIRVIHVLLIAVLLGYLIYNLISDINSFKTITQSFEVVSNDSLVPPGLAFCITKNINYDFNITIQGEVKTSSAYLSPVDPYSQDFTMYKLNEVVAKCWIMKSPSNSAVIQKLPPNKNVEDMVFTYTRIFDTPDSQVKSPILVNVFDPLEPNSLFQFNRFLKLDPDTNRAIHFSRTQNINLNNEITNDVKYTIINEFQDPQPNNYSSTNKFTVRAVSFDISKVKDVRALSLVGLLTDTLTLLGVLFNTFYLGIMGRGKYAPWGLVHYIFGYIPIEHIKHGQVANNNLNAEGWKNVGESVNNGYNNNIQIPTVEDKLRVYLSRFDKGRYKN